MSHRHLLKGPSGLRLFKTTELSFFFCGRFEIQNRIAHYLLVKYCLLKYVLLLKTSFQSNDNMELMTKLQTEEHSIKDLLTKLAQQEDELKVIREAVSNC